jgi:glucan phosphoethanolaminetransferase (alkaline phosphatase superfamily)
MSPNPPNLLMQKKIKYFSAIFLFSVFSVYLLFSGVSNIKGAAITAIFTFFIVFLLNQTNKYIYLGYVCLLSIMSVALFLIQQTYGPVDFTFCLSTYFTNSSEAASYLNSVGYVNFGIVLLYILIVVICVRISNTNRIEIRKRSYLIVIFSIIFLNMALSVRLIKINKPTLNSLENHSYIFFTPVLKVFADLYYNISNVKLYLSTQDRMLKNFSKKKDYKFSDSELDKEIYVVVIGESVSKSYMHYYNAQMKSNTPFIESSQNIKFNNYIAPACNTVNSLTKLLTFDNSESSIINLLKEARDTKVAWISSQARIGLHENPVSAFALQSDTTVFISSKLDVASDFDAIKYVPKLNRRYKVIFVHIFGSHPNPCDRLPGTNLDSNLDCYSETISKLDSQLEYLQNYLKSNFRTYKLLYLSDHGIVNNRGKIVHGARKSAYDVPLLIWSDDISSKRNIESFRSGNDAAKLWEEFFDIDTDEIKSKYKFISDDLYTQKIFILDNHKKKILYENLK